MPDTPALAAGAAIFPLPFLNKTRAVPRPWCPWHSENDLNQLDKNIQSHSDFYPCTTKLPSTTLVEFLFQHKLAVISMCWLCTMCWLAVAPFTFAVLRKGGFVGYRLQVVGRSNPLSCPSTIWFQSSACVSCLLIEQIEVSLALVRTLVVICVCRFDSLTP